MSEQDAPEDEQAAESEATAEAGGGEAADEQAGPADGRSPESDGQAATADEQSETDDSAAETDEKQPGAAEEADGSTVDDEEASAVDDDLVERVRATDAEELAREISALRDCVDDLEADLAEREAERDELESKLKRKQADFQNFKKRQEKKREAAERRATEDLVGRLLDVRDNLVRALDQDEDVDVRDGVETTKRQFDRVLEAENVEAIDPEPGTEVDPQRHEVLMRVESDLAPGTVDEVHRPGYEMAGKVLRPAQVTVAEE